MVLLKVAPLKSDLLVVDWKVMQTSLSSEPELFQIKIAGMQAELEQVYKITRHFAGNFEKLAVGCYRFW